MGSMLQELLRSWFGGWSMKGHHIQVGSIFEKQPWIHSKKWPIWLSYAFHMFLYAFAMQAYVFLKKISKSNMPSYDLTCQSYASCICVELILKYYNFSILCHHMPFIRHMTGIWLAYVLHMQNIYDLEIFYMYYKCVYNEIICCIIYYK